MALDVASALAQCAAVMSPKPCSLRNFRMTAVVTTRPPTKGLKRYRHRRAWERHDQAGYRSTEMSILPPYADQNTHSHLRIPRSGSGRTRGLSDQKALTRRGCERAPKIGRVLQGRRGTMTRRK